MGECFGLFFFIATSLLGIVTLLERLCVNWLREREPFCEQVVLTMHGRVEDAEFLLRRYALMGIRDIRVVDAGMDEQTAAVVARFMSRHSYVTVERT